MEVLNNLIENALNYGGNLVELNATIHEDRLFFNVLDNGEKLSPGDVEKMLTPFWRGIDSYKHGVGLGLPIAQKTSLLIGAKLNIQIGPQVKGTQITVDLPICNTKE